MDQEDFENLMAQAKQDSDSLPDPNSQEWDQLHDQAWLETRGHPRPKQYCSKNPPTAAHTGK